MYAASDRLEFAPPPTTGLLRALALAVLAHSFLLAALTWGVQWKRESMTITAEAELWSSLPQEAAPKLVEPPPEPPAESLITPPLPPSQVEPELPNPEISMEREKLHLKQQELEKQHREKLRLEKLLLEKKRLELKREQDTLRKEALKAKQETQKLEIQRNDNLKRIAGLAGATGAPSATGIASKTSGPSNSYGGKIIERIKANTNFTSTDPNIGKPSVIVMLRVTSDGTIVSHRIVTPSSNPEWDEAVLGAFEKMKTLPRDTDGKIPEKILSEGLELKVTL